MRDRMDARVIGAGLAGSEAAWQLAQQGWKVELVEMRPQSTTPAHQTGFAAEMVCSNSFKSDAPHSATGILKAEMARLGSLILETAQAFRVPAGQSLAVDREHFSKGVTERLQRHPNVSWRADRVEQPDLSVPTLLATGPLTDPALAAWISQACGSERLYFYDAIAPIVLRESINRDVAFPATRYDKGSPDFLNCPLDQHQYARFLEALLAAPRTVLHDFETAFFEACLPIEVMAERGPETLRFGPMKPVGLTDPRTGRWPYAAVQLRQDTLAGDHFNMVGFQTRLSWKAQPEVFRLIPGLESAEFVRFGSIHRNTYVCAPEVLTPTLAVKSIPNLWIAGQLSGVEGYLESAASGLAAARSMDQFLRGKEASPLPRESMLGALLHYLAHSPKKGFSPMNAMLGLLPELSETKRDLQALGKNQNIPLKQLKGERHRARALAALEQVLQAEAR